VRTIRLDLAYDGTAFHGWQRQPRLRTVQGVLEAALAEVVREAVAVIGAGRTDAGVHARGQVATFRSSTRLPARAIVALIGRRLPVDLEVWGAADAPEGFDARRSARARRYAYRLLDHADVLWSRIAWHPRRRLDPDALAAAAGPLEGRHDFAAFQASGGTPRRSECVVHRAGWRRWEGGLLFEVVADHFLYRMVRNLVGTTLEAASTRDPAHAMQEVLDSRQRARGGATVPPQGLCLEQVFYAEGGA
jgi:tRNA pseudouridine38-40 synthase